MEVLGLITIVVLFAAIIHYFSYKPKTIRLAMRALKVTTGAVPNDSAEYFPPPAVMKATLKENFFVQQSKASIRRNYGKAKAQYAAYHLLDYVGHLFIKNSKPDIGAWCFAAREQLSPFSK